MTILQTLLKLTAGQSRERLGSAGQQPRRELEWLVRQRAVQFARCLTECGYSHADVAQRLAIHERTLRSWNQICQDGTAAQPLGRPLMPSDATQQEAVFSMLDTVGPGVGVPTLRARFPDLARAELDDLVKCYRRRWRTDHQRLIHVLHWRRPGTVWAIDFAQAPSLIDGCYKYVLAVRDLASGQMLLWRPVAAPTADIVVAELRWLFTWHGPPLVLKSDNGSAFIADELRWELQRWGVGQLFSPPHRPEYNGSIEASIGALKTRTETQCTLQGHPELWTSAAVEAAQADANTAHPRRLKGDTPEQVWESRPALTADERAAFLLTVEQYRTEESTRRGLPDQALLSRTQQASVDRVAYRRALVAHDLLLFRRRRIPPRIPRPKSATKW
jgi:transposase InsO family protein